MLLDALDKKKRSFPLPADLVTFTEEIVNGKLHFLRSQILTYKVTYQDYIYNSKYCFICRYMSPDFKYVNIKVHIAEYDRMFLSCHVRVSE